jgi:hypothetical protein
VLTDLRHTRRELEPGARVVWAPVAVGTVVRAAGDQAYVVDLDDGQTITAGWQLLVEVPREAPGR